MALRITSGDDLAEEVISLARTELPDYCTTLWQIWMEMWDENERAARRTILMTHVAETLKDTFQDIIDRENAAKEEYGKRSERFIEEIEELKVQLGVDITYDDVEELPLHCMAKTLNERAARYRKIREDRLERLRNLRQLEETLRSMLGTNPYSFANLPAVPSEAQLEELADHVKKLQDLKVTRTAVFLQRRKQIIELYSELGETPKLKFDMDVVSEDRVENFQITAENMANLDDLLERLTLQLDLAKERRQGKVERLQSLWSYLEEPVEKQENFLRLNSGCTIKDFEAMQIELERCNKEKHENIGKFVERIRNDLEAEWEHCLVGPNTRSKFSAFNISTYSEDLYQLHEDELERWKHYYSSNKELFELWNRHKTLFNKLVDLDGLGRNTTRYQNRGGQLLQEERQRKAVFKDLPRVEEELKSALALYESSHGEPFLYFDEPLAQVLEKQWDSQFDQRIIEKFRGGDRKMARTPKAVKRQAITTASTGSKYIKLAPRSESRLRNRALRKDGNETFCLEPTYDEFQRTLNRNFAGSKTVSRSTEVLSQNRNKKLAEKMKSTPNIASPRWAEPSTAPKTVPRAATRRTPVSGTPQRIQTRSRVPFLF